MDILLESYFSKDDIELNIDKFPSETNIMYVTGLSGSGKTTRSDEIAEKYKAVNFPLDIFFYVSKHTREFILDDLKKDPLTGNAELDTYLITYIKKMPERDFNFARAGEYDKEKTMHVANMAFDFIKAIEKDKKNIHSKVILEGVQIFLSDATYFKDKPIVIEGTGLIKSNYRAIKREFKSENADFGDKISELLLRIFSLFAGSLKYESKRLDVFKKSLNENVNHTIEKRSIECAKQEAISAIIASRLRHMADNEFKETRDVLVKVRLKRLRNELAKEKIDHLLKLVIASETTNDRVSVDIHDDAGNKSIIADFDGKTHMGLHAPKGQHNLLGQDRVGRRSTTSYGENDKFVKNMTGHDLPELLDTSYKDMKQRIGLQESEFSDDLRAMYGKEGFDMDNIDETLLFEDIMLLDEGRRLDYYKYVKEHTNNVRKAYRWMKKHIPELFLNWRQKAKTDLTIMKHDLSKWQRKEFVPYSKHFKGTEKEKAESQEAFQRAWNHHQKVNKHHWQYWVLVDGSGHNQALDMPFENIIEMIADWWSFSWKSGKLDEIFSWYANNKSKMILSPKTSATVEMILNKIKTKLHALESSKKLEESIAEYANLDEDLSNPYEDVEEDFYDDMPLDEETYLFCEDCEKRLEASLHEDTSITKEQAQYAEYLTQHITNVKRGYFWIKENAPEILEGCDLEKVEANLIVHDESKYSKEEYDAYSRFFYGERTPYVRRKFRTACMHHFMNNPHHPEWWLGTDMSQEALVEALCDWWSFSWKEHNMNDIFEFWKKAKKHKFGSDMTQNSKDRMQILIEKLYKALDRANML